MFGSRSLAIAAAIAISSMGTAGLVQPAPQIRVNAPRNAKRGLFNDVVLPTSGRRYGTKGAGISMAQQQRAAKKARNVRRHKAASRG